MKMPKKDFQDAEAQLYQHNGVCSFNDASCIIRKATPNDTEDISKAIVYAGGYFLPWLFGRRFREIVHEATNSDNCSFSWINSIVCEYNERIVGIVISYPSEKEKEMDSGLSIILKKYFGIIEFFRFIRKARKAIKYFVKPKRSYYILAIAVIPEFRGKGISKKMLDYVEYLARVGKYTSIALEVESYNHSAIKAYEKSGFEIRYKIPIEKFSKQLAKEKDSAMLLMRKRL